MQYIQPLSVFFVYHPKDYIKIHESIFFCYKSLQRDAERPFSRFINIPVFNNTSLDETIPQTIKTRTNKTIVFLLISKYILANKSWENHYKEIVENPDLCTIPIALDNTAINFESCENRNFIRAYRFDVNYFKENFLLNITHEIYKWTLNNNQTELGKDKAVKIFLSHTKDGKQGERIALSVKSFIDRTNIRCFFDITDIAINYNFEQEIENHIKDSSVLIIHSDSYSSRYWCQKEIICAKTMNRPIIALDCLSDYEDRRFPHASNISTIRININEVNNLSDKTLYQIILAVLLETLRFHYSKLLLVSYKEANLLPPKAEILSRPPEFCDVEKIINYNNKKYNNDKIFIYPEPIVYDLESNYFVKLGIKSYTPISRNVKKFTSLKVGLSISDIDEDELIKIGQFKEHLIYLSQDLARYLLMAEATLIYGGDIYKDSFTEFVCNEAQILQSRIQAKTPHIKNYIAYPIYLKNDDRLIDFKAKYKKVVKMIHVEPPADIKNTNTFSNVFVPPNTTKNRYAWSRGLTEMRNKMIRDCHARICVGGRCCDYKGIMPGVLEEILIAISLKKPIFLLGGFGGVVSDVCNMIKTKTIPERLTKEWQIKNNGGYKDILHYSQQQYPNQYLSLYNNFSNIFTFNKLNNGLTYEENRKLFETPFLDEAIPLILKGLQKVYRLRKNI